jgi:hypothetical protein
MAKFAQYFKQSPDRLGLAEVRAYQIHLVSAGMSWVPSLFCAKLASESRLSQWPAKRSAVHVSTWLRSLGLDGLAARVARLDPADLHAGVAGGLVGVDDPIGASAARQGVVVDGVPAKPAAPEAATAR